MLYFDTSYIVRLYTTDPGWEKVRALAATDSLTCSIQGYAETMGAFHRKFRERAISQKELREVMSQFERDSKAGGFQWVPLWHDTISRVAAAYASLPATNALRAADAIHLATAAESGLRSIYSNDAKLLSASGHFGLSGVNVI